MPKKTITVQAASASRPCPKYPRKQVRFFDHSSGERRDRTMIYADEICEVANIRYYRRRILKGDLVLVSDKPARKPKSKPELDAKPKTEKPEDN